MPPAAHSDIPWPTFKAPLLDKAGRDASRNAAMADRPSGPVWVFAYGSLIWNPSFEPAATRHAAVTGYHRSFCFWTMVARGTRQRPGLGLALEAKGGATCRGVALQVASATETADLEALWAREMYSGVYRPTWVDLQPTDEPGDSFAALTFVADPGHPQYCPPLTIAQKAEIIAGASGQFGPCIDYLENVVSHLADAGEPDEELEELLAAARAVRRDG